VAGPSFIRAGTRAQSAGAATIAPAKPTVDGASGCLLALVTSKNNAVHSTATAGWSKLSQVNSGPSFTASLWIAAESAGAPTFTWTGSAACSALIAYYNDPQSDVLSSVSVSGTTGSGTTATHTSTGFTSDANNVLAIYADAAAANTSLAQPTGWTRDSDVGSATDAGRTDFGSKTVASSGSASGNISVTGAAAAWVQFQIELKSSAASGAQASKIEADAWLDAPGGAGASKIEAAAWLDVDSLQASKIEADAWLDAPDGAGASKIEAAAWLDVDSLQASKIEADAWLDPPDGLDASLLEAVAWLDVTNSTGSRRMSLM
jgi:hypothetical protein